MSDELKACPFCGSENHPYHKDGCFIINAHYSTMDAYNTRPLEDALLARAEHAETDAVCLRYENEALRSMIERLIAQGSLCARGYKRLYGSDTRDWSAVPTVVVDWNTLVTKYMEQQ